MVRSQYGTKRGNRKIFCDSGDYTVKEVAIELNEICRLHNATLSFEDDLMCFLAKVAPQLNWPIVERKGKTKSNIRSFGRVIDNDYIVFDVCVNGCMSYVGEEEEKLKYCGKCNSPRFYNCTHRSCVERTLIDCPHKISTLRSRKESYYFPMISTFEQLVSFEKFREEIKCFEEIGNYYRVDGVYKDVGDGELAKAYKVDMVENFENKYGNDDSVIMINLLLGLFYDGAQLFDNKLNSFSALIINVLNLPPAYRISNGAGAFVIGLQTAESEKTMFRTFMMQELQILQKGVLLLTTDNKKVFLQARLMVNLYDTKAFEKVLGVQCTSAKVACPICRQIHGVYRKSLKKVIHGGHRKFLPMSSILRKYGQSGMCCPLGYYDADYEEDIKPRNSIDNEEIFPKVINTSNQTVRRACDCLLGK